MDKISMLLLSNMMDNGTIRKDDYQMNTFITMNKDYTIDLVRSEISLWQNNSSYLYMCKLIFKNDINQLMLEISTTENIIHELLQSIYYQLEFNSQESIFTIGNITLTLKRDIEKDLYSLYIGQYSPSYQTIVNRIKIDYSYDSLIEFLNMLYYTFLFDLTSFFDTNTDFLI